MCQSNGVLFSVNLMVWWFMSYEDGIFHTLLIHTTGFITCTYMLSWWLSNSATVGTESLLFLQLLFVLTLSSALMLSVVQTVLNNLSNFDSHSTVLYLIFVHIVYLFVLHLDKILLYVSWYMIFSSFSFVTMLV